MARPLKIAKAQAVLTITATTATTNIVTVSQSLSAAGVIRGMPFITASTVGGLVGGVTYYVLTVLSDTTFLASATSVDANATYTPLTLTTTTAQTVAATVGLVDSGFNNPAGAANTYGVVGGNTAFFGNQVLVDVAIGQAGTGALISDNESAVVFGLGTDFVDELAAGSVLETTDGTVIGYVDSIDTVELDITETVDTGNFIITSDDATDLTEDQPVVFDGDIGGIEAGTTYFVANVANATHFTISASSGGSVFAVVDDEVNVVATQDVLTLAANAEVTLSGADFVFATSEAGYILRQKGKTKYLVKGTTSNLVSQCFTANVANTALTSNTMVIVGTTDAAADVNIRSLNNYSSEVFYDTANATADPDFYSTFNTAEAANVAAGINKPVITVTKG